TWVSTATQGLGPFLANATPLGPLSGSTPLHIAVGLKLSNTAALNQYIRSINTPGDPLYGSSLTVDQVVATYGPNSTQVQTVVNYLSTNGFSNIQIEPNNLLVPAHGTTHQTHIAFNTPTRHSPQTTTTASAH